VRIGLIIYGRLSQTSGGYLYDRKLVEDLRKHGHQVQLISMPRRNYLSCLGDNFSSELLKKLSNTNFNILLEDELNHPSLFLLNKRLREKTQYPIVSIVHHLRSSEQHQPLLNAFYQLVEKQYLQSVDGFIFNSATTKKVVESVSEARKPNIVAHPAGDRLRPRMTAVQIRARARQRGPLRVLFLGSLIRRKAPHSLIEAMARLSFGTIRATLAGDANAEPGYATSLKKQVQRLGLKDHINFVGQLQEKQLTAQLRNNHVLVVPSSYEGYGIAYLEGMGFGLPAIGARAGGAGEIIAHGQNGFLIPVGHTGQLAAHLKRLHADRGLLTKMSLAARRRYLRHPTWQTSMVQVRKFLSAYNYASSRTHSFRRHL